MFKFIPKIFEGLQRIEKIMILLEEIKTKLFEQKNTESIEPLSVVQLNRLAILEAMQENQKDFRKLDEILLLKRTLELRLIDLPNDHPDFIQLNCRIDILDWVLGKKLEDHKYGV